MPQLCSLCYRIISAPISLSVGKWCPARKPCCQISTILLFCSAPTTRSPFSTCDGSLPFHPAYPSTCTPILQVRGNLLGILLLTLHCQLPGARPLNQTAAAFAQAAIQRRLGSNDSTALLASRLGGLRLLAGCIGDDGGLWLSNNLPEAECTFRDAASPMFHTTSADVSMRAQARLCAVRA